MKFELQPDREPHEYGLYYKPRGQRVCGIYVHPADNYTRLIWWSKQDLPDHIETTDMDAVKLLVPAIAAEAGEWI